MSQGKIEFTLGALSFSGEGEQDWLAQQLHKILEVAPEMAKIAPFAPVGGADPLSPHSNGDEEKFTQTLASYIKAKDADSNQQKRFLATADWLRRRGTNDLKTAMVTKALQDSRQKRLGNPADCLNKNVTRGYCEKNGDGFFITPDGLESLG